MIYMVSACLAGCPCRYNGGHCANEAVQALVREGKAFFVCPEQLVGMPTPRESCEIVHDANGETRVIGQSGRDYTAEYKRGAEMALALCKEKGVTHAILKSKSPSCGCGTVYDGTFSGRVISGDGLTAVLLKENGIQVQSEVDLVLK